MLPCPYCGSNEKHSKDGFEDNLQRYQCRNCRRKFTSKSRGIPKRQKPQPKSCLACGKLTMNAKYCSLSCASTHTNQIYTKRTARSRVCKYCQTPVFGRRTVCDDCNRYNVDWSKRTIGDMRYSARYQKHAVIRDLARTAYAEAKLPRACSNCGYNKHVEICHIHAISSFPDETLLITINDLSNLVALCPNCHWEFDHGLLKLD